MAEKWKIRFITDWDEIYSLEFQKQWLQWIEDSVNSHVFFHPALCMAWLDAYRRLGNLQPLFCIAECEDNICFLPLVLWQQNWKNAFRRLVVPVGYSDFDYHDPLIIPKNEKMISFDMFFSQLIDQISQKFTYDKLVIHGLRETYNNNHILLENDIAPFISIGEMKDLNDFLQKLKLNIRKDIKRQYRRLEEIGEISLISFNSYESALVTLNNLLLNHRLQWPYAYKAPQLYENILQHSLKYNIIHLSELQIGDQTISYHLGFRYKKRFYCYMIAINPDWLSFSPGKIHLFKLAEELIKLNFSVFDFLRGNEIYKARWTEKFQKLYCFQKSSTKLPGSIRNWAADKGKHLIKWQYW